MLALLPSLQSRADDLNLDSVYQRAYLNLATEFIDPSGALGNIDINYESDKVNFLRSLFNLQELPTDEALCRWYDAGISDLNYGSPKANNPFSEGFFIRLMHGVDLCNMYIFNSTDASHPVKRAEMRFMRALYLSYALDMYGKAPVRTAKDDAGKWMEGSELFGFITGELKAIESSLPAPGKATASTLLPTDCHADQATAWMLLARLYLNAQTYTGTADNANAALYAKKVIESSGRKLHITAIGAFSPYQELFAGDNSTNGAEEESLLTIPQDYETIRSWGSTTFLIAASWLNGSMAIQKDSESGNGLGNYWGGLVTGYNLVKAFNCNYNVHGYEMTGKAGDDRALFDGYDSTPYNGSIDEGFKCCKFINLGASADYVASTQFANTDFFLFRLPEAYLTYVEATARQNGGAVTAEGLDYVNAIRSRAHAAALTSCTLDELCTEWSREFYFEGLRRTTLIRFGKFTSGDYVWPWKGGTENGTALSDSVALYAVPDYPFTMYGDTLEPRFTMNEPSYASTIIDLTKVCSIDISWNAPQTNTLTASPLSYSPEIFAVNKLHHDSLWVVGNYYENAPDFQWMYSFKRLAPTKARLPLDSISKNLREFGYQDGDEVELQIKNGTSLNKPFESEFKQGEWFNFLSSQSDSILIKVKVGDLGKPADEDLFDADASGKVNLNAKDSVDVVTFTMPANMNVSSATYGGYALSLRQAPAAGSKSFAPRRAAAAEVTYIGKMAPDDVKQLFATSSQVTDTVKVVYVDNELGYVAESKPVTVTGYVPGVDVVSGENTTPLVKDDQGNYMEYVYLDGDYTITSGEGTIDTGNKTGVYKIEYNANTGSCTMTQISNVSMIGDFTASPWSEDVDLTYDKVSGLWCYDNLKLESNSNMVIRLNHDWSGSLHAEKAGELSGSLTTEWGGESGNITVTAGTYNVRILLSAKACTYTFSNTTGISTIKGGQQAMPVKRYSTSGQQVNRPVRGITIISYSDGTTKKVIVK